TSGGQPLLSIDERTSSNSASLIAKPDEAGAGLGARSMVGADLDLRFGTDAWEGVAAFGQLGCRGDSGRGGGLKSTGFSLGRAMNSARAAGETRLVRPMVRDWISPW